MPRLGKTQMRMSLLSSSLVRFLLVGVVNTCFGLSIIFLAKWVWLLDDVRANVIGYALGISVSFILNKRWTFAHGGSAATALARFLLITGIAYVANLATVLFTIENLSLNSYLAQAVGVVSYTAIGYLGSRYFVFVAKAS